MTNELATLIINEFTRWTILYIGSLMMGIFIGYELHKLIKIHQIQTLKDQINDHLSDILGDLARYAIIAGENYEHARRRIHTYRSELEKLFSKRSITHNNRSITRKQ